MKLPSHRDEVITIERENKGCKSLVLLSSVYIFIDVLRQTAAYGMKYFNNDTYPIPQTQLIMITEILKLALMLVFMCATKQLRNVRISLLYLIPSVTYAINNNIGFYALHFTTPPVWNVLTQMRTVFMAAIYRGYFKRTFTYSQYAGLLLLVFVIGIANISDSSESTETSSPALHSMLITVCLSLTASALGALGPVFTEYLFKNDSRSFGEKQLQLYMFGCICTGALYVGETGSSAFMPHINYSSTGHEALIMLLMAITLLSMSATGFSTAFIMKKLDNIVKLYAQSITNMIIALICAFIFPEKFHIDAMFFISLILIFVAIFLYENDNVSLNCYDYNMNTKLWNSHSSRWSSSKLYTYSFFRMITVLFGLAFGALVALYLRYSHVTPAKTTITLSM